MEVNVRKNLIFLIVLVVVIAFSAIMADQIESSFGDVEVSIVEIIDPDGNTVVAKLFRPKIATADNPLPAVVKMGVDVQQLDTAGPTDQHYPSRRPADRPIPPH